jgi:hypothetical protein
MTIVGRQAVKHVVPRLDFKRWTEGWLMERNKDAVVWVSDEAVFEAAMQALDAGETIYLKQRGQIVTTMRLTGKGYVEELYSPEEHNA